MRYNFDYKTHIVATGVIESFNYGNRESSNGSFDNWENFEPVKPIDRKEDYNYILAETCKELKIDLDRFRKVFNKIKKEVLEC